MNVGDHARDEAGLFCDLRGPRPLQVGESDTLHPEIAHPLEAGDLSRSGASGGICQTRQ
jgi:hypothetical protein